MADTAEAVRPARTVIAEAEWRAEAVRRFGADPMDWRFICPSCKHVAAVRDWYAAGAPESVVAFSCVGRWTGANDKYTFRGKGGPCNYAGGGLFRLNPVAVERSDGKVIDSFAFDEAAS